MINQKELYNYQRVYINGLEKRLNEAVSPAYRQAGPLAGVGGGRLKENVNDHAGYRVMRFTDTQVLKDIQNVIAEIEKNIEKLERQNVGKFVKVHPQPPPAGDIAIAQVAARMDILSSEEYDS